MTEQWVCSSSLQFLRAVITSHSKGSWGPFRRKAQPAAQPRAAGLLARFPPSHSIFPLPPLISIWFHQRFQAPGSGFNQELELSPGAVAWQSSVRPRWNPATFSSSEASWRKVLDFRSPCLGRWSCGRTIRGPFLWARFPGAGRGEKEDCWYGSGQQSFCNQSAGPTFPYNWLLQPQLGKRLGQQGGWFWSPPIHGTDPTCAALLPAREGRSHPLPVFLEPIFGPVRRYR